MANICYIHSYGVNHYQQILDSYFVFGNEFFNFCDEIKICYYGEKPIIYGKEKHIQLNNADELETLNHIYNHAKSNEGDNICYIHTKGVTNDNECISDWRNYMFHFCCKKYKDRISNLIDSDTCGVDLREEPKLHYSGNFWWSRTNYIRTLCKPEDTISPLTPRHRAEFWITSGHGKHTAVHDCGISVYDRHLHKYPPNKYEVIK